MNSGYRLDWNEFSNSDGIANYLLACVDTGISIHGLEFPDMETVEVLAKHAWALGIRKREQLEDWMPGMGSLDEPRGNATYYKELADILRSKKDGVSS